MTCIVISRKIGPVKLDAVMREEHRAEMEIAEHPVESGAKISDHAWSKPYIVRLESVIGRARAKQAWKQLLEFQEKAEPFDLVTGLVIYNNMLVKELSATRDPEHSQVLYFECELQEVRIVDTDGGGKDDAANGGKSKSDAAKKTSQRGQVSARPAQNIPENTNSTLANAYAAQKS